MQSKHTQGPWTQINEPSLLRCRIGAGFAAHNTIAEVHIKSGPGESEANARLIAAAPDLLAACKLAIEYDNNPVNGCVQRRNMVDALNRAIARAEGTA